MSRTLQQASIAALEALERGDQRVVNQIMDEYTLSYDYDSRAHLVRMTRAYNAGWSYQGNDWVWEG